MRLRRVFFLLFLHHYEKCAGFFSPSKLAGAMADGSTESAPIAWEDPRFPPAIEAARKACGVSHHDDDAMFAMLLDVCDWDHEKVQALYAKSARRRLELGT